MAWYTIFKNNDCLFDGKGTKNAITDKFNEIILHPGEKKQLFKGKSLGRLVLEERYKTEED